MDTQVKLEHEVSFRWLIVFALPTILSSIFSSLYSTLDGIFIARLVDTDALSAINITMPMILIADNASVSTRCVICDQYHNANDLSCVGNRNDVWQLYVLLF